MLRVWNAWSVFPVRFVDDLEEIFSPRAKPKPPIDKAAAAAAGVNGAKDSNLFSQLADIIQSACVSMHCLLTYRMTLTLYFFMVYRDAAN